jgi:hypothetical protein
LHKLCNRTFLKLICFSQIQQILEDKTEPLPGEERLAALTAGERTHWANVRRMFFSKGINKTSLDVIEKAAFVVVLDDFPYEFDMVWYPSRSLDSPVDSFGFSKSPINWITTARFCSTAPVTIDGSTSRSRCALRTMDGCVARSFSFSFL